MQAAFRLQPGPDLQNAALNTIMRALGPDNALIVGGAVRSAILGEAMGDIDIATKLTPDQVTWALTAAGLRVVPTGIDHGTVTAVADHEGYEITTLRRDVETDGRRAVVAFTDDWLEDAQRRDFTMNTLLMNLDGDIFDPTGQGVADLKTGIVRFVGDPDTRIAEDALRILRFFRFHARYGQGAPDAVGLAACKRGAALIKGLSRERVTTELEKILLASGAGDVVMAMLETGIVTNVIQKDFRPENFKNLQRIVLQEQNNLNAALLMLYAIFEEKYEALAEKIDFYLSLSNRKKDFFKACMKFLEDHTDSHLKNLAIFGQDVTLSGTILLNSLNEKSNDSTPLQNLVDDIRAIPVPQFPVNAKDIMQVLHVGEGKFVGDALKQTFTYWLDHNTQPDRAQCLDFIKTLK